MLDASLPSNVVSVFVQVEIVEDIKVFSIAPWMVQGASKWAQVRTATFHTYRWSATRLPARCVLGKREMHPDVVSSVVHVTIKDVGWDDACARQW